LAFNNKFAAGNAATLVRQRTGAGIPVDVVAVASEFVDIERADWPVASVDGITINCSSPRPQVFYAGDPEALRTRFTIAHELGHAVMAWHIGTAECAMQQRTSFERSPLEQEADYFASELLLPSDWLKETVVRRRANLDLVLQDVAQARASATASMIAISSVLPQGWALQLNNQPLAVTREFGPTLDRDQAEERSSASGWGVLHNQTIRWWRLFDVPPLPAIPSDKETAYIMLDRAWGDHGHTAPSRKSIDGKVSGLLGANLNRALDLETGFGYLLFKLGADALYETPDFRGWLAWKAANRLTQVDPEP
jgi:hypothetical protein